LPFVFLLSLATPFMTCRDHAEFPPHYSSLTKTRPQADWIEGYLPIPEKSRMCRLALQTSPVC
jgi:hypothetical protein